jgi:hypothetical protein
MRTIELAFLFLLVHPYQTVSAESQSGSVCIAPVLKKSIQASAPGLFCESEILSLKIDTRQAMPWPILNCIRIGALDTTARHRVVVFCGDKPQQSFTFRFSKFKTGELCLFLNDLYKTAQMWDAKRCPWCKCK